MFVELAASAQLVVAATAVIPGASDIAAARLIGQRDITLDEAHQRRVSCPGAVLPPAAAPRLMPT